MTVSAGEKKKREREQRGRERKRAFQPSFSDPRSSARSKFVEPSVKVHLLDKGYAWVPKMRDFTEDPREEISENQKFRD